MTRTNMRKELLLGTVALVAGIGLASAQDLREGGSAGGSERGVSSGSSQMSPGSGVSIGESTCSPVTRRMFSLSPAGKFGLEPEVNGGFHQVL